MTSFEPESTTEGFLSKPLITTTVTLRLTIMGCGKSSKLVTPVFVMPAEKKDPQATTETHGNAIPTPMPGPVAKPVAAVPAAQQPVAVRTAPKPVRNSDLGALYPPPTGKPHLRLEFVYGYRVGVSRNNVFYLSASDIVVYPCGSMAVLLSVSSNTQRFLGGGEVHSLRGHFGDVISVAVNREKDTIATSEQADLPTICIWKLPSIDPQVTIQLGEESKGIDMLAFSSDSKLLTAIDMSAEQTIRVFQIQGGTQIFATQGRPGKVRAVAWSLKANTFCTVGEGHVFFWTSAGSSFSKTKGELGQSSDVTMSTAKWTATGECVMGGSDGKIYVWSEGRLTNNFQILPFHSAITALCIADESVIVGGKDGKIHVLDPKYAEQRLIDTPGAPTSLDMSANGIICGTEEGILLEFGKNGRVILMDVHSGGELSAVAVDPKMSTRFVSIGADNKIKSWDLGLRKCIVSGLLEVTPTPVPAKALSISSTGHVAVGHSDGHFTIRTSPHQLNNIRQLKRDPKGPITVMKFSPAGNLLAVGTESGLVQVFNGKANYSLLQEMRSHKADVVAVDWNAAGTLVRSQDKSMTTIWWRAETGEKVPDPRDEKWASDSLFHQSPSGFPPSASSKAHKTDASAQGTIYGVVELATPALSGQLSGFKAHSGAIRSLLWSQEDDSIYSVGATDMCIMQWKFA